MNKPSKNSKNYIDNLNEENIVDWEKSDYDRIKEQEANDFMENESYEDYVE